MSPAAILHDSLAYGISRGFLVAAGIALLALAVVIVAIRTRRDDLAGASGQVAPATVTGLDETREFEDALR